MAENIANHFYVRGLLCKMYGRLGEAIDAYNTAIKLNPNNASYYNGKGLALIEVESYKEALDAFNSAINLNPNHADYYNNKGFPLTKLDRYKEALNAYNNAIELNPNIANYYQNKGSALLKLEFYEEAFEEYNKAIKLDSSNAEYYFIKGTALIEIECYKEALNEFNEAIKLNPNNLQYLEHRGGCLCELGRYNDAVESFNKAIDLNHNIANLYFNRGVTLDRLKRFEDALVDINTAIELNPNIAEYYDNKGIVLNKLEFYEDALASYNTCIEIDPNYASPWLGKALVNIKKNQISDAEICFYRYIFLSQKSISRKEIPIILEKFHNIFYAPFIIIRIFNEVPYLYSYITYKNIFNEAYQQSEDAIKIIDFLRSDNCNHISKNHKKQIEGLITFFMGDPIKAKDIFNEALYIDSNDLLSHYYLLCCLENYYEDDKEEYILARDKALSIYQEYKSGKKVNEDSILKLYYAGHLLYQNDLFEEAIFCFNKSSNFLPSLYMQLLIFHELGREYQKHQTRILNIIFKEEKIISISKKNNGFLNGISIWQIDINDNLMDQPFLQYAHSIEIVDALKIFYELFKPRQENEKYNKNNNNIITKEIHAFDVWKLNEQAKTKLKEKENKDIEELLFFEQEKLKVELFDINLFLNNTNTLDVELNIAQRIDEYFNKTDIIWLHRFVQYLYLKNKIEAQTTILLHSYIIAKKQPGRKKNIIPITIAIKDIIIASGISLALYNYLNSVLLNIIISMSGAGFIRLIEEHFKIYIGKKSNQDIPYSKFKNNFIQFANKMKIELKDAFFEKYPLNDFEKWAGINDFDL